MRNENTLASLSLDHSLTLRESRHANFERYQGAFPRPLKQPTRSPEASRKYVVGDPSNLIDWRAYARTDQLLVRERQDESNARVYVYLDASPSMLWPDRDSFAGGVPTVASKFSVAARVALHLCYTYLKSGDYVLLATFDQNPDGARYWQPSGVTDALKLFHQLVNFHFNPQVLSSSKDKVRFLPPTHGYIISDGLSARSLQSLPMFSRPSKRSGERLLFLHLLSSLERDISWAREQTCYFAPMATHEYLGKDFLHTHHYNQDIELYCRAWEKRVVELGGAYFGISDRTSVSSYLNFLKTALARRVTWSPP